MTKLLQQLPQLLLSAVATALQQVPVTVRPQQCAQCITERLTWGAAHAVAIARAEEALRAAAAELENLPPEDRPPLNPLGFLPEELRPGGRQGVPQISDAVTAVAGTQVCAEHIPGAPGRAGQSQLLIARASLTLAGLAQMLNRAA
jgi:hypothetical protein